MLFLTFMLTSVAATADEGTKIKDGQACGATADTTEEMGCENKCLQVEKPVAQNKGAGDSPAETVVDSSVVTPVESVDPNARRRLANTTKKTPKFCNAVQTACVATFKAENNTFDLKQKECKARGACKMDGTTTESKCMADCKCGKSGTIVMSATVAFLAAAISLL